ncbi:MAG: prolipoprotein diacylglyceryl transferase, partial [Myxococcota bacterium]
MSNEFLILGLTTLFAALLPIACQHLPKEKWQFIATVPRSKCSDGTWAGVNLSLYGLLSSTASIMTLLIALFLLFAVDAPWQGVLLISALLIPPVAIAARVVARIVEGKKHTFTVAGAVFVGMLL